MSEKTEHVMVRLSPEIHDRLKSTADANERTISQTVRLAIREHLEAANA